jgi:hypothetical protein
MYHPNSTDVAELGRAGQLFDWFSQRTAYFRTRVFLNEI